MAEQSLFFSDNRNCGTDESGEEVANSGKLTNSEEPIQIPCCSGAGWKKIQMELRTSNCKIQTFFYNTVRHNRSFNIKEVFLFYCHNIQEKMFIIALT